VKIADKKRDKERMNLRPTAAGDPPAGVPPIQNDLAILCVCNGLAVSHRH